MDTTGYTHIYTGNGKGKTTAAMGLALRAIGYGDNVYIMQFMKSIEYSEIAPLRKSGAVIEQCADDSFVFEKRPPTKELLQAARNGLEQALQAMLTGRYRVVILDEACVSIYFGVLTEEDIAEFIRKKPKETELIITGRYCPQRLMDMADLVTEMKEIKHYYTKGITSRPGIDC